MWGEMPLSSASSGGMLSRFGAVPPNSGQGASRLGGQRSGTAPSRVSGDGGEGSALGERRGRVHRRVDGLVGMVGREGSRRWSVWSGDGCVGGERREHNLSVIVTATVRMGVNGRPLGGSIRGAIQRAARGAE